MLLHSIKAAEHAMPRAAGLRPRGHTAARVAAPHLVRNHSEQANRYCRFSMLSVSCTGTPARVLGEPADGDQSQAATWQSRGISRRRHATGQENKSVTSVMSIESSSHPPSVGFPRMSFGFSETCRRTHPSAAPTTHARTTAPRLAMPDRPQSPAYSGCLLTHASTAMPAQCRTRRSPRSRT
jgi:hypothetical protein